MQQHLCKSCHAQKLCETNCLTPGELLRPFLSYTIPLSFRLTTRQIVVEKGIQLDCMDFIECEQLPKNYLEQRIQNILNDYSKLKGNFT